MRHFLALPLALMLCAASAHAESARAAAPDADRRLARGLELLQAGDILSAIDASRAALAADRLNNALRMNLALACDKSARPNDAIPRFRPADRSLRHHRRRQRAR
jgi:Tfp pilus assembly protein PilF